MKLKIDNKEFLITTKKSKAQVANSLSVIMEFSIF